MKGYIVMFYPESGAAQWFAGNNRGFRRAYNFPIQATAAELIGDATEVLNG